MTSPLSVVAQRLHEAKLPRHVTAGILSNFAYESGGDPAAIGDGGHSIGLAQWNKDRGRGLLEFAKARGGRNTDPAMQADYLLYELAQDPKLVDALARTKTPGQAAMLFQRRFERPAKIDPRRGSAAGSFMRLLGPSQAQAAETKPVAAAAEQDGPWTKYAAPTTEEEGPWTKFAGAVSAEIDTSRGAPAGVRAVVGSVPNEGRLATLQHFYPKARITPVGGDNFEIDDPKEGRFLYNPSGLDLGDVASLAPEAGEMVGGGIGATLGAGAGPLGSLAGAGLGAAGGRELVQLVAGMQGGVDPRTPGQAVGDAAVTTGLNAAGQGAGEVLGYLASGFVRTLFRGGTQGRQQFAQAVADADRWNVPISAGQASGAGPWSVFDSMAPGAAQEAKEAAAARAQAEVGRLSTTLSGGVGTSARATGVRIQRGVQDYRPRMRAQGHALDQAVFSQVPLNTPVPMQETVAALPRLSQDIPGMPATSAAEADRPLGRLVASVTQDLAANNGTLTLEGARGFRRSILDNIESAALVEGIPTIKLRDLYSAVTRDIRGAVQTTGGPGALAAFDRANAFWRRELTAMDEVLGPLVAKQVPEATTKALKGSLKDGPSRIGEVLRVLTPQQRGALRAAQLQGMGIVRRGTDQAGGTWSFERFLDDWNGLDPQARNLLFPDHQYGSDLRQLADTAARLHVSRQPAAIPTYAVAGAVGSSVMSGAAGIATGGAGWFILPVGFALTAMGASGGARLMRNRTFVHWLAQSTTMQPRGWAAHVGRLSAIAADSDPDTRDDIQRFLDGLGGE